MIPKNCLVDTGFWIGYFDETDSYHSDAVILSDVIFAHRILCPFPSLYEFLNTRFSRNPKRLAELERVFSKIDIVYIHDDDYRETLLDDFVQSNRRSQSVSAVDLVINSIIEDINYKIDYVVTFNRRDFLNSCLKRNIDILP